MNDGKYSKAWYIGRDFCVDKVLAAINSFCKFYIEKNMKGRNFTFLN